MIALNDDLRKQIELFGEVAEDPEKIAEILKFNVEEFNQEFFDKNSEVRKIYNKGLEQVEFRLEQSALKQAVNGKIFEFKRNKRNEEIDSFTSWLWKS